MSQSPSTNLQPLEKSLRKKLESAVKDARNVVEAAAKAACLQLGVGAAKADSHLSEDEKDLRRRLRIHGRQLGDELKDNSVQEVDRLVEEIGYQHWHRMLFARFLAENNLLMYPDPDQPVAITLEECEDLAADEGAKNGWELAAKYAATMLPQIFRVDSPVFALSLPTENQQELEQLLSDLPEEVFRASDSLGWVYQFWQADAKKRINESEVKIGARELPAVTQLFTEPYMVSFLLDNSLGAWWAGKRLTEEDFCTMGSEQELRDKVALPGVPLEYLRFVRTPSGSEGKDEENTGSWTPAAGTFDAWPESLSELKTLDPCCGSGHFLVAALLMLAPMRMELEGLSAKEAVDRVLSENLHGLEIDQRCVELAAFALALAAWRFPEAGGYRALPDLNVACCGLSVGVAKEEWKKLAGDNKQLQIALDWMYDEFKDAPVLGSLFDPKKAGLPLGLTWNDVEKLIESALSSEHETERLETAVVAHGLVKTAQLLTTSFTIAFTNVPYLGRGKQSLALANYSAHHFAAAKSDLATTFVLRVLDWLEFGGTLATVAPQNWLYLTGYHQMRKSLLDSCTWNAAIMLGPNAFQDMNWWAATTSLVILTRDDPSNDSSLVAIETSGIKHPHDKARFLSGDLVLQEAMKLRSQSEGFSSKPIAEPIMLLQSSQLKNPDSRIVIPGEYDKNAKLLSMEADSVQGTTSGDNPRFVLQYWELSLTNEWVLFQGTVQESEQYGGRSDILRWEKGEGELSSSEQARIQGQIVFGKTGVFVSQMRNLAATRYTGEFFNMNGAAVVPNNGLPHW